jgi:hypothetical protein
MEASQAGASTGAAKSSDNYNYLKNPLWWAGMATSAFRCRSV